MDVNDPTRIQCCDDHVEKTSSGNSAEGRQREANTISVIASATSKSSLHLLIFSCSAKRACCDTLCSTVSLETKARPPV